MSDTVRDILERQAACRRDQMDADIAAVLETPAGRRVLIGMLAKGGVWTRTGCADGDALRLAYAAGRRDAAADVLAVCNRTAAGRVAQAMGENNERVARWNAEIDAAKQNEGARR